jgi:prefoldin subunit 5
MKVEIDTTADTQGVAYQVQAMANELDALRDENANLHKLIEVQREIIDRLKTGQTEE